MAEGRLHNKGDKMIDEMVVLLKTEQLDENDKKEYCKMQFDHADDEKKSWSVPMESSQPASRMQRKPSPH